ncbi:unannotated protein [freshwater metagenome]|uniref:Unannotated protein n=1 Tax=freshwater metagenome TaxID=449393 RepID=A0A6J6YTM8_9ZZZZ|nr:mycothiol synthase [Actinomycetota bacterium]
MTPTDIAAVTGLLNKVEIADSRRPLNDHLWIDLRHGGRAGFAGLIAWDPDSVNPVAYCQVSRGNDSWALDLVIDPHHRDQTLELGIGLLQEAENIIANEGGGHVHWWVFNSNEIHDLLAAEINLKAGRNILQLEVKLPLAEEVLTSTENISTVSFQVGIDETNWLLVNNRAFANHPEQGGWTIETLLSRLNESWFNASGLLLHFVEQPSRQLAGFCWTKLDKLSNPTLGEIYVIAVDPDHHNKGLGRSLTVAGLNQLAAAGATTGMLFVDKENAPAISVYFKIGFSVHHEGQAFIGEISPRTGNL